MKMITEFGITLDKVIPNEGVLKSLRLLLIFHDNYLFVA